MVLHSLAPTHAGLGECESGSYPGKKYKDEEEEGEFGLNIK